VDWSTGLLDISMYFTVRAGGFEEDPTTENETEGIDLSTLFPVVEGGSGAGPTVTDLRLDSNNAGVISIEAEETVQK
jgi:hypothetical protein